MEKAFRLKNDDDDDDDDDDHDDHDDDGDKLQLINHSPLGFGNTPPEPT